MDSSQGQCELLKAEPSLLLKQLLFEIPKLKQGCGEQEQYIDDFVIQTTSLFLLVFPLISSDFSALPTPPPPPHPLLLAGSHVALTGFKLPT